MEKVNKIITWKGKQYVHIIADEPAPFCDFCAFGDECQKVLYGEITYDDSPMKMCDELCKEVGSIGFAYFEKDVTV